LKNLPKLTTKWLMIPHPQNYDSKKHIPDFFFQTNMSNPSPKKSEKIEYENSDEMKNMATSLVE
jgi:hypothetical protein